MALDMDTLHGIIDETQSEDLSQAFDVKIVDESQTPTKNLDIKEVYVNRASGVMYLIINSEENNGE
jgi:hypothetical protein